jgi:site-specific DNA recombinase
MEQEIISTIMIEKYAVAYVRVSTTEQVDNFSLGSQQEEVERKAQRDGYILQRVFKEPGQSAKDTNRPELQALIKYCLDKKNKITAVIVYKWDRLSRSQLDFLTLRQLFAQHGISLLSATETSGDTPEALFLQNILSAAAQYENDLKSVRVKDGMRKRFLAGYLTSKPPIGYTTGIIDGKTCGVPDEKSFQHLQRIWYRIDSEKWTLGRVKEELDKLKIHKEPFCKQSVSKIFANKYYMGTLVSEKYGESTGKHRAMVEEDVFYRVREIITGRKQGKGGARKDIREEVPLRGHLYCPLCGKHMGGAPTTSKSGRIIWYYVCAERKSHKTYEVNADRVHEQFLDILKNIKVEPHVMKYFAELMKERYQERYQDLHASAKAIEKDIEKLDDQLKKLKKKHLEGYYTDDEFKETKEELKIEYVTKKSLLNEKAIDRMDIETILEWMTYYLTNIDILWTKASIQVRHRIQRSLLPEKMTFDDKCLRTPKLGLAYRLNELFEAQKASKYPGRDSNPQPGA